MDSTHRIPHLSLSPTVERQTPHDEFGTVLAQTVDAGLRVASGIVSLSVSGGASAAIAGIQQVSGGVAAGSGGAAHASGPVPGHFHDATAVGGGAAGVPGVGTGSGSGVPGSSAGGSSTGSSAMDLLEAQRAMQQESYQFQAQYLRLQDDMQRESREFNAVTNIMKVRHDSAKAAISNIR